MEEGQDFRKAELTPEFFATAAPDLREIVAALCRQAQIRFYAGKPMLPARLHIADGDDLGGIVWAIRTRNGQPTPELKAQPAPHIRGTIFTAQVRTDPSVGC
jgi:hypothetical protein